MSRLLAVSNTRQSRKSAHIIIFLWVYGAETLGVSCPERELHVHRPERVLKMHLCQISAALLLQCSSDRADGSCGRGRHLSPYAGIANSNPVPAHRRHSGAHHWKRRDGDTSGCTRVLLPNRWEDQALLRALLMPMRRDWPTLGVVLVLLDDGRRLGDRVA